MLICMERFTTMVVHCRKKQRYARFCPPKWAWYNWSKQLNMDKQKRHGYVLAVTTRDEISGWQHLDPKKTGACKSWGAFETVSWNIQQQSNSFKLLSIAQMSATQTQTPITHCSWLLVVPQTSFKKPTIKLFVSEKYPNSCSWLWLLQLTTVAHLREHRNLQLTCRPWRNVDLNSQ